MQVNEKEYFLVTTAMEEFWDSSKKMLFLGHWCLLCNRKDVWKKYNYEILTTPWNSKEDIIKGSEYIDSVVQRLLSVLSYKLAELHNLNYQSRFWQIFLERWLYVYVSNMYDRYVTILKALKQFPNFTTITLSEDCFIVPNNFEEFDQYVRTDCYNLQIYSSILQELDFTFSSKKINCLALLKPKTHGFVVYFVKILRVFRNEFYKIYNAIMKKFSGGKIAMIKTQLPVLASIQLLLFGDQKFAMFKQLKCEIKCDNKVDIIRRLLLSNINFASNKFEGLLIKLLKFYLPRSYLENFSDIAKLSYRYYPYDVSVIFSTIFGGCDVFGYWLAQSAINGVKLAGLQHGGNIGVFEREACEKHDLAIVDYFYTWGWTRSGVNAKVISSFVNKLFTKKIFSADNSKQGVLWCITALARYQYDFQLAVGVDRCLEYIEWQKRFFMTLNSETQKMLTLRVRQGEYGWSLLARILEYAPDIKVEIGKWGERLWGSFLCSLSKNRLYVTDHLSTTYLEALAVNQPTILFWNPDVYDFRKDASPYFEELHEVGILYYSPEEVALAVNEVYNDVEKWWGCEKRQLARRNFCSRYARMPSSTLSEWKKIIHDF